MLSPERVGHTQVAFDDHRLVANGELFLPVTLTHRLSLAVLVDCHADLEVVRGRANAGDKMLTVAALASADGDCNDDTEKPYPGENEYHQSQ